MLLAAGRVPRECLAAERVIKAVIFTPPPEPYIGTSFVFTIVGSRERKVVKKVAAVPPCPRRSDLGTR